jgi:hypothetical protein
MWDTCNEKHKGKLKVCNDGHLHGDRDSIQQVWPLDVRGQQMIVRNAIDHRSALGGSRTLEGCVSVMWESPVKDHMAPKWWPDKFCHPFLG